MLEAVLFPSSYFEPKTVDEDMQKEYDAAVSCGLYKEMIIFSYEAWFDRGKLRLNKTPDKKISAVYRGWMMQPEQYKAFYEALIEANIELITTPDEYALFHIFPNVYEAFAGNTPQIMLFPKGTDVDLDAVKKEFSRFMVKDYVKSVKGTDFPVFFDASVTADEFAGWMKKFYEYRGGLFTGGICIKEFVDLKRYGERKNEHRVFYMNGEIATISRNSGQAEYAPQPPMEMVEKYRGMNSRFYTIDFAELSDGSWTVIEAGDGSVSGLSDYQNYREFFRKLYMAFA